MGASGIGIVRLSGTAALPIIQKIFSPSKNNNQSATHMLRHCYIIEPESREKIDEVLVCRMMAPHTFTREDMAEINCHGGIIPLQRILDLCLKCGARLADAGEFTKRAYINGRIDLAQAEAVIDIINAKTQAALKSAVCQLDGGLSDRIKEHREELLDIQALIEAGIDFPDEELEIIPIDKISEKINSIEAKLAGLIKTFAHGRLLKEGITTAIIGKPNVGKSTLLNQLLNCERAIVTPIAGTTRDTIAEDINIGGFPVKLVDTAGITKSSNIVEQMGISRSRKLIQQAEMLLVVLDGSMSLCKDDLDILECVKDQHTRTIIIINKCDLPLKIDSKQLKKWIPAFAGMTKVMIQPQGKEDLEQGIVHICAASGQNLDRLQEVMIKHITKDQSLAAESVVITNARHHQALLSVQESLLRLKNALKNGLSAEFLAVDLNEAIDKLGDIVGEAAGADVLDRIFSKFCIGK